MKSLNRIAEQLNITAAIIRSWQINLNLNLPKHDNDLCIFDAHWELYFEKVAHLRQKGQSFKKIRKQLALERPSLDSLVFPDDSDSVSLSTPSGKSELRKKTAKIYAPPKVSDMVPDILSETESLPTEIASTLHLVPTEPTDLVLKESPSELLLKRDLNKMTQTYVQLVENYQALASRYSESTYLIGQLEETNRGLEDRLKALKDSKDEQVQNLESHVSSLKDMLKSQEERLDYSDQNQAHKSDVELVENQLKLLAVTLFKQQKEQENLKNLNFWSRFKANLFKPL